MLRVVVASLVAAVVLFVWGFLSWTMLPWHKMTMGPLKDEAAVMGVLKSEPTGRGVYYFPQMPADWNDAEAMKAYEQVHVAGPAGLVVMRNPGGPVMPGWMFAASGAINLAAALIASTLLGLAVSGGSSVLRKYAMRVLFVTLLGLFAGVMCDGMFWVWFRFPTPWTLVMIGDRVVAWLLAGLVIGAIVKPGSFGTCEAVEHAGLTTRR